MRWFSLLEVTAWETRQRKCLEGVNQARPLDLRQEPLAAEVEKDQRHECGRRAAAGPSSSESGARPAARMPASSCIPNREFSRSVKANVAALAAAVAITAPGRPRRGKSSRLSVTFTIKPAAITATARPARSAHHK
jgi:hypothetical protein